MFSDTIAAISTPAGTGAIALVRLSGPGAMAVAGRIFAPSSKTIEEMAGHTVVHGRILDGEEQIDEGLLTVFRAPRSYTGEDMAEISCHGVGYITGRVLRAALDAGARLALPGEFTKRAFVGGKLNLSQAEGIMDLIGAGGAQAARAALSMRKGVLSETLAGLTEQLVNLAAHLAAWTDYPEEDVEALTDDALTGTLDEVYSRLQGLLATYDLGRIVREGIPTAIVGRPNVGKSSLMNQLSGTMRSIVTDIPGTTRDVVENTVRLGEDVVLLLADTAGIRRTDDPVEAVGVQLADQKIEESDLILCVLDGSSAFTDEDYSLMERFRNRHAIGILNKADLPAVADMEQLGQYFTAVVSISAKTGEGLDTLVEEIRRVLRLGDFDPLAPHLANERQRGCVLRAVAALEEARQAAGMGMTLDALSINIDEALAALLELDGRRVSDTVVDQVFEQFCVGK